MGLFSSEGVCSLCGASGKGKVISSGFLCNACAKKCAPYLVGVSWKAVTPQWAKEVIDVYERDVARSKQFVLDRFVNVCIDVDEHHRYWKPTEVPFWECQLGVEYILSYDQIRGFELLQNGETVTSGGLEEAIAGGLLFGKTGAIVGGLTADRRTNYVIKEYKIRIDVEHPSLTEVMLYILPKGCIVKTSDPDFRGYYVKRAKAVLSFLDSVVNENKPKVKKTGAPHLSAADEILQFKQLMDQGIITAEEFRAKKKQLLNL